MARPSSRCRASSLRSLAAGAGEDARPRTTKALRPPLHPECQARRWRRRARRARGRRHCTGPVGLCRVHVPRRSSNSPVHVPRRGLICHPGCYGSSHNRPFCPIAAQSGLPGKCAVRPAAALTTARAWLDSVCGQNGGLCATPRGGLRAARFQRARRIRTKVRAALPQSPVTAILPALRASIMAPPPPWSPVCGRSSSRRAFRIGLDTTMPGARRPAFIRFAHSLGLPPAAQSGAVAPRCRAPPLRGWRVALARRWRAATPPTRASRRAAETRRSAKTVWA